MTFVHLLPEDATILLKTAAKSLDMDPGDLLLLLWYRGCDIGFLLLSEDMAIDRDDFLWCCRDKKSGLHPWLSDLAVVDLAKNMAIDGWIEAGMHQGEHYDRAPCAITLSSVYVRSGDAARATMEPLAPADQEQKDLSPKRERTLLKMIGALLAMRYTGPAYENSNGGVNVSRMAERLQQDMAKANINADGLKDRTLRDLIPLAMEAIKENMAPE